MDAGNDHNYGYDHDYAYDYDWLANKTQHAVQTVG
jgi:hypothetical protein